MFLLCSFYPTSGPSLHVLSTYSCTHNSSRGSPISLSSFSLCLIGCLFDCFPAVCMSTPHACLHLSLSSLCLCVKLKLPLFLFLLHTDIRPLSHSLSLSLSLSSHTHTHTHNTRACYGHGCVFGPAGFLLDFYRKSCCCCCCCVCVCASLFSLVLAMSKYYIVCVCCCCCCC